MIRISFGLLLIALTTLMVELTLIRVFDVIWYPNMAYMVITLALFCFGLSGVFSALRPLKPGVDVPVRLGVLAALFGVFTLLVLPFMNLLPFNFTALYNEPFKGLIYFLIMYGVLVIPFFLSGLIFTTVFSTYAGRIQSLYFWDLVGAAVGCVILIPFLPRVGPGGLLFFVCGFSFWAAALFCGRKGPAAIALIVGIAVAAVPLLRSDGVFEFRDHIIKRGVKTAREKGRVEFSHWDPISKIDVIDQRVRKHIAYDGGSQSSFIFPFDGDYETLRKRMPKDTMRHFGGQNVYLSHYLKRDSGQKVLIIGSAGGQETKAALMYGAARVDAVEMVGTVVRLGKTTYADYNGGIFNHPHVNAVVGEGRSFLRASTETYDIIQMFSNHTSSSIAAGTGAMATTYLQTAEAYLEYFRHLAPDGILHINHHIYPRMVSTAALAWKLLGRTGFQRHVLVFEAVGPIQDNLPTMLIKMSPWKTETVEKLRDFFVGHTRLVEDPIRPQESFLPPVFYSGNFPPDLSRRIAYRAYPCTDDRPYFNFLRKKIRSLQPDPPHQLNYSTAALLNSQLKRAFFPRDIVHLIVTGAASIFFTVVFIVVPLFFSNAGRTRWPSKASSLAYFSCLGAGFIIFELVFIQLFMKLVGYPLYTYSTVVFALLLAAGAGSYVSGRLKIGPRARWQWPFIGVLVTGVLLLIGHQSIFNVFLTAPVAIRALVAGAMIFPLGFFLGMPFPIGILAIEHQPRGAVAWAWGMNGLFTVIGGFVSVLLSIFFGFVATIVLALAVYGLAFVAYGRMRRACL